MSLLVFLAFLTCCLAQLWLVQRLATALKARHPQVYEKTHGLFSWKRLVRFAVTRGDRQLGDPDLTTRAKQLQLVTFAGLGLWIVMVIGILTGHRP